jgi:hypothetical protein
LNIVPAEGGGARGTTIERLAQSFVDRMGDVSRGLIVATVLLEDGRPIRVSV